MPPRIYYPELKQSASCIDLPAKQAQHLRVLRLLQGEEVELFDGKGQTAQAKLLEISKKRVALEREPIVSVPAPETHPVHLLQALTRHETMDWILQKATELGVKSITPLICERTQGRLKGEQGQKKQAHWQEVLVSACEQSGLNFLPVLNPPILFVDYLQQHSLQNAHFILDPQSTHSFEAYAPPAASSLLIGPEGGWTASELLQALAAGAQPICIHANVLRAETAAVCAISLCQYAFK